MTSHLFERYYFQRPGFVDGTTEFHSLCKRLVNIGSDILEIGAGPANATSKCLAEIGPTTGVDVSEEVLSNHALSAAVVYDGFDLPFSDSSFDVCVSNYVLEHVSNPALHLTQVQRVLRSGGIYILRTPNLFHYVSVGACLIPNSLHSIANSLRSLPSEAHEPYPTYHRCNTVGTMKQHARDAKLIPIHIRLIEKEPSYGRIHPLLFYPMMGYERCVNRFDFLSQFRSNIVSVLKKPDLS